jgi:hypothetical protein
MHIFPFEGRKMIPQNEEYKKLINHRLAENVKSFKLLFDIQHYGNCISIMCQELDQVISLLFLLNSNSDDKKLFINSSINSQKWYVLNRENKKEYITDEMLVKFAESLKGWDKSIYEFGLSFGSLSKNFNYGSRDPIKSMNDFERDKLYSYIKEYHNNDFKRDFSLNELIPVLPLIIEEISKKLKIYMEKI